MPPKAKYTKDDLIEAALEVIKECGLNSLSARSIAKKLGSSTAPVYSIFSTMAELELETVKRIEALLLEYSSRPYTDRVFLNMGMGMAIFARDERQLYRALFLERGEFKEIINDFLAHLKQDLAKDIRFAKMSDTERGALLEQMAIVTHGLASLICVGLWEDDSNDNIKATLMGVGASVIEAAIERSKGQAKE